MPTLTEHLSRSKTALLAELAHEVSDPRVLNAIARVPRERFVPPELRLQAYENRPLPIGYGQTISQPLIVAVMTQALDLRGDERVLEVGTGSGYQAALLSQLAAHVVTVERVPELARQAERALAELGYSNVEVQVVRSPEGPVIITLGPCRFVPLVGPGAWSTEPLG